MTVDRNDAPEGYEAQSITGGCLSCAFGYRTTKCDLPCLPWMRADGQSVVFIKRPEQSRDEIIAARVLP